MNPEIFTCVSLAGLLGILLFLNHRLTILHEVLASHHKVKVMQLDHNETVSALGVLHAQALQALNTRVAHLERSARLVASHNRARPTEGVPTWQ
jgi:hypothetical protein